MLRAIFIDFTKEISFETEAAIRVTTCISL